MSNNNVAIIDWLRTKVGKILIPKTLVSAVYDADGKRLDTVLDEQKSKMEKMSTSVANHSHSFESLTDKPDVYPPDEHTHSYESLTDKPDAYPPEAHTHSYESLTDKPDVYPPEAHTHSFESLTDKPDVYPPEEHTHTFESLTDKPEAYPPEAHTHSFDSLTDKPEAYPPADHTHTFNDLTDKSLLPVFKSGSQKIIRDGDYELEVSFGCTFKTPPAVTFSYSNYTGSTQGYVQVYDVTTTGCRFVCYGTSGTDAEYVLNWTAIGYQG